MVQTESALLLGTSQPRRVSARAWAVTSLVVAACAVVALVLVVQSGGGGEEEPAVLASANYVGWLKHFGPQAKGLYERQGATPHSLKKLTSKLSKATARLNGEMSALRDLQNARRRRRSLAARKRQQRRQRGQRGQRRRQQGARRSNVRRAARRSNRRQSSAKLSLPKGYSASRVALDIEKKLSAFHRMREKAARYLLKDIAAKIIYEYDRSKGKILPKRRPSKARSARKLKRKATALRRVRRGWAGRPPIKVDRRRHTEYQVNKGQYVVVINQRNFGGRPQGKDAGKKGANGAGAKGAAANGAKGGSKAEANAKGKGKAKTFKAVGKTDKRLERIARIAMRAAKSLQDQRKVLVGMRDARKKIIKAATEKPKPVKKGKVLRIQAPVVVITHKAQTADQQEKKELDGNKIAEAAQRSAKAAKEAASAAGGDGTAPVVVISNNRKTVGAQAASTKQ